MAVIDNTYQTSSGAGKQNREVIIYNAIQEIDPDETPLYSMIGSATGVKGIDPAWVQDSLPTPDPNNAKLEGDQYTYAAVTQPARVKNYTQIFRREFIISKSQENVDKVGKQSEVDRNKIKVGIALRTDIEVSMLSNNASVGGLTRKSAGLRAWTATNDSMGATGSSGGYNTNTGVVDAATNGTQRAFTKALMDAVLLSTYSAGGKPNIMMLSPYAKSVFDTFMSDANVVPLYRQVSPNQQAVLVGAAGAYQSSWGLVDAVPNRQLTRASSPENYARNVFFITPGMLEKYFFRPIAEDPDVAPNADAEAHVMICEFALINRHEKAHGVVADVFGINATT